jgi:uncharacterized protein
MSRTERIIPRTTIFAALATAILFAGWGLLRSHECDVLRDDGQMEDAFNCHLRHADRGTPHDQFWAGVMLHQGWGVDQDDWESLYWLKRSASQHLASAETLLGKIFMDGNGVDADQELAVRWFRRAAEQDDTVAQLSLAGAYLAGRGVPTDKARAVYWVRKAAETGNAEAQFQLGVAYAKGDGVARSIDLSVHWMLKAGRNDHLVAQHNLGHAYTFGAGPLDKDQHKAVNWYRRAAAAGLARAQRELGERYLYGNGVATTRTTGIMWLRKAQSQGITLEAPFVELVRTTAAKSGKGA